MRLKEYKARRNFDKIREPAGKSGRRQGRGVHPLFVVQKHAATRLHYDFCTWIAPRLVCQIKLSEWTCDAHLRQPVFLGLREDKDPREVVRETPKS